MNVLWEWIWERLAPHFIFIKAKQRNVNSASSGLNFAAAWPAAAHFLQGLFLNR